MARLLRWAVGVSLCAAITLVGGLAGAAVTIKDVKPGEDVLAYMERVNKGCDQELYKKLVGAANPFKEADEGTGVAADNDKSRENARKLLANAVRLLHPRPRVRITAPATVEAVVTDDPASRTLRVHLLGYNAPPQTTPPKDRPYVLPATIEDAPIFRATIELDPPLKRVEAFNKSTVLKRKGARVQATVSDIHDVLQFRY